MNTTKKNLAIAQCLAISVLLFGILSSANCETILDQWDSIKAPAAPEIKAVTLDPKTTALLLLDFNKQTCNPEQRPRCIASIPAVKKLADDARAHGLMIVYSLSSGATTTSIAPELAPAQNDPVVTSGPDKFLGTDLLNILSGRKIETVVVVGTAAQGAVLYTSSGAALRGMRVVVPIEGISAEMPYEEQYTLWHLAHAPRISSQVTITKMELIKF